MKKIIIITISLSSLLIANEFVVKKRKLPSLSKLKEQCCSSFARQHNRLSDIVTRLITIQKTEFNMLRAEFEGTSCFDGSKKEKLQALAEKSVAFEQELEMFERKAREYYQFLKTL